MATETLHPTVPKGMCVALYKGTRSGVDGLYNRLGRLLDRGPYSHCELIFSDGQSGSSSFMDGGVRLKQINYTSVGNWDFLPLRDAQGRFEKSALAWMYAHDHCEYDIWGNIRFFCGLARDSADKWFCSEAIMAALGFEDSFRYGPNGLAAVLPRYFCTDIVKVPANG